MVIASDTISAPSARINGVRFLINERINLDCGAVDRKTQSKFGIIPVETRFSSLLDSVLTTSLTAHTSQAIG